MDYSRFFSADVPSFLRSPVREIFRKVDLGAQITPCSHPSFDIFYCVILIMLCYFSEPQFVDLWNGESLGKLLAYSGLQFLVFPSGLS